MERKVCSYCGLPFRSFRAPDGQPDYCCSGCAMAARMKITSAGFPVTSQLVYNLVIAFCVFNQALLLLLAAALTNEQRIATAGRFAITAALVGVAVFAVELFWQWRATVKGRTDAIVFASAGVFVAADIYHLVASAHIAAALSGFVATSIGALWQVRGVARKWVGGLTGKAGADENTGAR